MQSLSIPLLHDDFCSSPSIVHSLYTAVAATLPVASSYQSYKAQIQWTSFTIADTASGNDRQQD
eukprot:scaffold155214_cov20-Tisochrysis_lutea.AAC.2